MNCFFGLYPKNIVVVSISIKYDNELVDKKFYSLQNYLFTLNYNE